MTGQPIVGGKWFEFHFVSSLKKGLRHIAQSWAVAGDAWVALLKTIRVAKIALLRI